MLRFVGKGKGFLPGVPARDLTEEEAKKYGGRLLLIGSGLYVDDRPTRPARKAAHGGTENQAIHPLWDDKGE